MVIQRDNPTQPDITALLLEHVNDMRMSTPTEACHVLDLTALQQPSISFFTARTNDGELQGCCALKKIAPEHGEVKSMRTVSAHLRKGVARRMILFLIEEARGMGLKRLSLETGAGEKWLPARRMYESVGFKMCGAFGDYKEDERSCYMTISL